MSQPDPGWWSCEGCGGDVRPSDAYTKTVSTHEGTELLAFCEDCTREPTRSEPADFGGGDSTGVQDL